MKITELSRISGINAATIRSYRLKGFLHPVKEKNGYYDYTAEDLVSLAYLRKLRGFSMSLEDIDTLFEASDPGRMLSLLDRESCRIQAKIHELEEQLRFLDFEKQHLTESMQKDGDSVREFQAIDDKLDFYEVKRDPSRMNDADLIRKSAAFFEKNPKMKGREMSFRCLSIKDM